MRHSVAERQFEDHLAPVIYTRAKAVLRNQYKGDIGYNPGSQMIQIAGISVLSPLDHFIKEKLRVKWYLRYMDDFILIYPDHEYLAFCREQIAKFLLGLCFELSPKKTRIYPLKNGIRLLGFTHRLASTGKVIRTINPENVKTERKRLFRMVQKVKRGKMSKAKADACYRAWKAHAEHGNSFRLLRRMDQYYNNLWKGEAA